MASRKRISYKQAGVNIEESSRAVKLIRDQARSTFTPGVLTEIGSFGAAFRLPRIRNPVLISSADGVGTKLKLAFMTGRHSTVGEDLVNHCVNDIAVQGARPLFFLDYFATGKLQAKVAAKVVEGIARGCRNNQCALIGGETAEMPGLYQPGEYDLAGFIVGVVERERLITGSAVREGDVLLGLPSNGLHTNGYSLARKLLFEAVGRKLDRKLADELMKVHRSYLKPLRALIEAGCLHGAAHITGGGITENTPRMLPDGLGARISVQSWTIPPIFEELRAIGNIPLDDYRRTFNLGIGMVLAIPLRKATTAERILDQLGERHYLVGCVIRSSGKRVVYDDAV